MGTNDARSDITLLATSLLVKNSKQLLIVSVFSKCGLCSLVFFYLIRTSK